MHAVAIGAHRDFIVALGPLHSVHAGLVLLELIDAQAGVVLLHPLGIGVARGAKFGNLLALDLALPSRRPAHRLFRIIAAGVATMARRAGKPLLRVDVLAVSLHADTQRLRQIGMAIETGVLRLRESYQPAAQSATQPEPAAALRLHVTKSRTLFMQPHFATQP